MKERVGGRGWQGWTEGGGERGRGDGCGRRFGSRLGGGDSCRAGCFVVVAAVRHGLGVSRVIWATKTLLFSEGMLGLLGVYWSWQRGISVGLEGL